MHKSPLNSKRQAISRVLYLIIIYLDTPSLMCSCDPPHRANSEQLFLLPLLILLQMGFTRPIYYYTAGELLPRHFNLTTASLFRRNIFCCTFPMVTHARRYLGSCSVKPGLPHAKACDYPAYLFINFLTEI